MNTVRFMLLLLAAPLCAATHYVALLGQHVAPFANWTDAATNIQAAVDAAVDGDLVLVSNGVYNAGMDVVNGITVKGAFGAAATTIDLRYETYGCYLAHPAAVVEDLTFKRCYDYYGGGVYCDGGGLVRNCILISNWAGYGGGVSCNGGGVVTNCTFIDNFGTDGAGVYQNGGGLVTRCVFRGNQGYFGGGVRSEAGGGLVLSSTFISNSARYGAGVMIEDGGLIADCTVVDNVCTGSSPGGAIYLWGDGCTAQYCYVAGNWVSNNNAFGAGVVVNSGALLDSIVVSNTLIGNNGIGGGVAFNWAGMAAGCVIADNLLVTTAGSGGGGVYADSHSALRNCLIVRNTVRGTSAVQGVYGGGVFAISGATIESCTMVSNAATGFTSGGGGVYHEGAGSVFNSIVYFNNATAGADVHPNAANVTWSNCCVSVPVMGSDNITNDPQLAGVAAGDFHLTLASPCVDSGVNLPWMAGATDIAGNDRIINGIVDRGAYEFATNMLRCTFVATPRDGWSPFTPQFTAFVSGANTTITSYAWDFTNDGTSDVNGPQFGNVSNTYAPGIYAVALTVSNSAGAAARCVRQQYVESHPPFVYVAPGGAHVFPYISWVNAATTLQAGVDAAWHGATVLVAAATYRLTNQVSIVRGAHVLGVAGAAATLVDGQGLSRCFYAGHPHAVIEGFTITNGFESTVDSWYSYGGGVYLANGATLRDSTVVGNRLSSTYRYGGGVYIAVSGLVYNCVIRNNSSYGSSSGYGGGVYSSSAAGVVRNCLVVNNSSWQGGGVYGGTVQNGTVCRNACYSNGGGCMANTVQNSIVCFNTAPYGPNYESVTFSYSCTTPQPAGAGNFSDDPGLLDSTNNFNCRADSPCIDAGLNAAWMTNAVTLGGIPRVVCGIVDIGAHEFRTNALRCAFSAAPTEGWPPLDVAFTPFVAGANTAITYAAWDFEHDGTRDHVTPALAAANTTYATGDFYTVVLTVSNAAGEAFTDVRVKYIRVNPRVLYASPNGAHQEPFSRWATAATNIQSAIALAQTGTVVLVSNGVYRLPGLVTVAKALTLRGAFGAGVTILDAQRAGRCLTINHAAAVVDNLTISNGYADASLYLSQGAGVMLESGLLSNCVICCNTAYGNAAFGGGVYNIGGTLRNCLIYGNQATYGWAGNNQGGGVFGGAAENCILRDNFGVYGGGAKDCALRNCLVYRNRASQGGGAHGGVLVNCTIVSNSASGEAGGVLAPAAVTNCIVYFNDCTNGANYSTPGAKWAFSCTTPDISNAPGMLAGNPLLVDLALGDARLAPASPCIGAGTNQPWMATATDLDGRPRSMYGRVDMGAYEYAAGLYCDFTAAPTQLLVNGLVQFSAVAAGTNMNSVWYRWDFDNSGAAGVQGIGSNAPLWRYAATGLYTVVLAVSNAAGETYVATRSNYIIVLPAVAADFTANICTAAAPRAIAFTDLSRATPQFWQWDFDGNGTIDSTARNPARTYSVTGTFTVLLSVSNNFGIGGASAATLAKTNYIVMLPALVTAFSANPTNAGVFQNVQFTDASLNNPTHWFWDFDNNGTIDSIAQNPGTNYAAPGYKSVKLIVSNAFSTATSTKLNYIRVNGATPVHYVWSSGAASPPYTNWASAATNVQAAIDAAEIYDTVLVSNGVFRSGGVAHLGMNNFVLRKPVDVLGVGGAVIDGAGTMRGACVLSGSVQCVRFENGSAAGSNDAARGGGVLCEGAGRIDRCIFANNAAAEGGAVCVRNGAWVYSSLFITNSALVGGAASVLAGGTLYNATIANNSALSNGGGVYTYNGAVWNTIVCNNTAPTNANYWNNGGNTPFNYCCLTPFPGGTSNITHNPQLQADYSIGVGSPCRGKGNYASWMRGMKDLGGVARAAGTAVDMGAYEYVSGPVIAVMPLMLNFGELPLLQGTNRSVDVSNAGLGVLTGQIQNVLAPFSLAPGSPAEYVLPMGAATSVTFRFAPTDVGLFSNLVTCTGGGDAVVTLLGEGVPEPALTLLLVGLIGLIRRIGRIRQTP